MSNIVITATAITIRVLLSGLGLAGTAVNLGYTFRALTYLLASLDSGRGPLDWLLCKLT